MKENNLKYFSRLFFAHILNAIPQWIFYSSLDVLDNLVGRHVITIPGWLNILFELYDLI